MAMGNSKGKVIRYLLRINRRNELSYYKIKAQRLSKTYYVSRVQIK